MDASEDESPRSALVSIKLPPVPAYPAPLPPSLSEAPVWDGPEPDSDSDDEYSSSETGDYEQIEHEPLTEEQARETLNDVVRKLKLSKARLLILPLFPLTAIPLPYRNKLLEKKDASSTHMNLLYLRYLRR